MTDWATLIPEAPFDWALIPLDGRKRPIDPDTGIVKDDWQTQDGYDVEEISALNGLVEAVGLMLGEKSGGILQVDFDGPNGVPRFNEVYGRSPTELPPTNGVTSGKEMRGSRFFLVDPDWWSSLRGRKVWKDDDGEICLELRWAGHQAVIAGAHPETKGYSWLPLSSPADRQMAMAPDWLLEPLLRSETSYEPVEVTAEDAQRAINMLACIDPADRTDYDGWLEVGMALHHTDEGLLDEWVKWSEQMPNFDAEECIKKWESFAGDYKGPKTTIRSLHHWAKAGGYVEPKKLNGGAIAATPEQVAKAQTLDDLLGPVEDNKLRRPRTDILTKALALVLPLKFNLLTQRIENDGTAIDGDFLGTLYLQLAEFHKLEVNKDRAADAAMVVARRNAYHPVRDYLNSGLPQLHPIDWDEIAFKAFNVSDPWAQIHLQRQLVGLVARAIEPGCKLDTSLVIHSPKQGIGKSRMWAVLGGEWFSDSLGDLRNLKDDVLSLHSAWIHEWGEIDAVVGKRESETLKKFLSAQVDNVRKPYGRGMETLHRSCGIVGTTNRDDFIKDPTGNRRFPVILCFQVNIDWLTEHRDAIWGSALAAYKANTPWHYSTEENEAVSAHARLYAAEDVILDAVESWCDDHPDIKSVSVARVIYDLNPDRIGDQEFSRQISKRLRQLGWQKSKTRKRGTLPNGSKYDKAFHWEWGSTESTAPPS